MKSIVRGGATKTIVITSRGDDIHAALKGEPGVWGCGKSVWSAIGNLITAHPEEFEIGFEYTGIGAATIGAPLVTEVADKFVCRYCGPGKLCRHHPMCEGAP